MVKVNEQLAIKKVVILGGRGNSTYILYNFLEQRINVEKVILEQPVPISVFIKRRLKKLGLFKVLGQILFKIFIGKYLTLTSQKRINEILVNAQLSKSVISPEKIIAVDSANSEQTIKALQMLSPDIVFVNGTRILSEKLLSSIDAVFINIHAGITPLYRGVHGAYWARVNNDENNVGVTVHLVDKGIDTGGILAQARIKYKEQDNFITYPYLQLIEGLKLLGDLLPQIYEGKLQKLSPPPGSSRLWTHPGLWEYLKNRILKKVK